MIAYVEETYTTQNVQVCQTGVWKYLRRFPLRRDCYFIKNGYISLDHPVNVLSLSVLS